jgi:lysophospholipase
MLAQRFTAPDGWQWRDKVETRSGQFIRTGWVIPDNARALVVLLSGLSEYGEKYFEVTRDLMARGFAVATMDWRGQGLSWREGERARRYHDDFASDVQDARTFIKSIPVPETMPRILLAHSMGGHLGLRVLHDMPNVFSCAVMTAPMFGFPLPEWLVGGVASTFCALGMRNAFMLTYGPWTPAKFASSMKILTSDPDRADMQSYWMNNFPDLRMGGLTAGWVRAALNSIRLVRHPTYLREITTPVLIAEGGYEMIVSNPAIRRIVRGLPRAEILRVEGSLHEVMMEKDVYRNQFWTAFDAFIAKHLPVR